MNAQLNLASTAQTVLVDQLATITDTILEVALPAPVISSLPPATSSPPASEVHEFRSQLDALTSQV